jgi:hypothetical protein
VCLRNPPWGVRLNTYKFRSRLHRRIDSITRSSIHYCVAPEGENENKKLQLDCRIVLEKKVDYNSRIRCVGRNLRNLFIPFEVYDSGISLIESNHFAYISDVNKHFQHAVQCYYLQLLIIEFPRVICCFCVFKKNLKLTVGIISKSTARWRKDLSRVVTIRSFVLFFRINFRLFSNICDLYCFNI